MALQKERVLLGLIFLIFLILCAPVFAQRVDQGGILIKKKKNTYHCSEYININTCLVKATVIIENLNSEKYNLEHNSEYTTSVSWSKFKGKNGDKNKEHIKKSNHKTDKIQLNKNSQTTIYLEFPITSAGKFNYSIDETGRAHV